MPSGTWGQPVWLCQQLNPAAGKGALLGMKGSFLQSQTAFLHAFTGACRFTVWLSHSSWAGMSEVKHYMGYYNSAYSNSTDPSECLNWLVRHIALSHSINRMKSSTAEASPHALSLRSKHLMDFDVCMQTESEWETVRLPFPDRGDRTLQVMLTFCEHYTPWSHGSLQ